MTISSLVARTSAAYLAIGGAVMLFGADIVLPTVIPAFPPAALFVGQLIAAGWLALASVTWQHRSKILGGIYGRPIVFGNTLMFTITALGMVKPATAPGASPWLWAVVIPSGIFAIAYGILMLRGPFDALTTTD